MKTLKFGVVVATFVSLALFFNGFLPLKSQSNSYAAERCCSKKRLSKVVLMVVDALKTEFVISERAGHWGYLNSLVEKNLAKIYNARVHTPTVTLPRIKALATGDIPGFIDVLMNFDTTDFQADNLLYQAMQSGMKSVFYGDDTWLKLFPELFLRSEGTTSFFVSDYTEVDLNVTRNLPAEFSRTDWDIMVLHYLGLDHIGHLVGPASSLVPPKLQEMDHVVEFIHKQLMDKNQTDYLIILCGDHGMADQGGHGGVSVNEVSTPMVFITDSILSHTDEVENIHQIDLLPTLSSLLNIPIAQNNRGVAITSLLQSLSHPTDVIHTLYYNCKQLVAVMHRDNVLTDRLVSRYETLQKKYHLYIDNTLPQSDRYTPLVKELSDLLLEIQKLLADKVADYDVTAMMCAFIMLVTIVCCHLWGVASLDRKFLSTFLVIGFILYSVLYVHCTSTSASNSLCHSYLGSATFLLFTLLSTSLFLKSLQLQTFSIKSALQSIFTSPDTKFYVFAGAHSLSLLASSFIEEEHQLVYFFSLTIITASLVTAMIQSDTKTSSHLFIACICLTIARKWNQTGDKWIHLPDIGDQLNKPEYRHTKAMMSLVSLPIISALNLPPATTPLTMMLVVTSVGSTALYVMQDVSYYSTSHRGVYEADVVYFCCAALFCTALYTWFNKSYVQSLHTIKIAWVLLMMLLHRTTNLPLLALISVAESLLSKCHLASNVSIHMYYWLGLASYFYQGNSNGLSTIDVGAGYKGMWSYNPTITPVLMFCNTYSGPIFWILSLCIQLNRQDNSYRKTVKHASWLYLTFKMFDMLVLQFLIILERYHLFVWTVFAPKLLYEISSLSLFTIFYILTHIYDC